MNGVKLFLFVVFSGLAVWSIVHIGMLIVSLG